ncbi:ent-kaurenoic acid oxidase 1 [Triticum aestivum]|nr:ent-kaurenoic acid oxidase 1-like [Triticum aestivum]
MEEARRCRAGDPKQLGFAAASIGPRAPPSPSSAAEETRGDGQTSSAVVSGKWRMEAEHGSRLGVQIDGAFVAGRLKELRVWRQGGGIHSNSRGQLRFHKRKKKCRRKLNAVFRQELEARKKVGKECDDLMSGLMHMKDEQGKKLGDEEVVDNIVSLVIAGYESTASAIMWATYHLAKSPAALAKLREENMALSESKAGSPLMITHDDLPKMKYTAKMEEETIRMANIAPMVHRVANKDVEYGGYMIQAGWSVLVWVRSLHTDPSFYRDPLTFNPDRWDEPAKPGTYQVLGGGYRICAGNMLARLQLTIMLHHLSIGYEWELSNPNAEIGYLPHPRPMDGATMAFRKLKTSA